MPISEEDRVVHFLTNLLDSYNMLVAALEAKVPKIEVVPERLLQEERGLKGRASVAANSERAMTGKRRPKATTGKFGHIRRSYHERVRTKFSTSQRETNNKLKANRDVVRRRDRAAQTVTASG